jgi:hypothetical protein
MIDLVPGQTALASTSHLIDLAGDIGGNLSRRLRQGAHEPRPDALKEGTPGR